MRSAKLISFQLTIRIGIGFAFQLLPASAQAAAQPKDGQVVIDLNHVTHTMAGGLGASWHALGPTAFWYDGLHGRINRWARGSCFGGNPPLDYTNAWHDLLAHACWLGLDFIRVEVDLRMYEPERGSFTWHTEEMRTLCLMLDYCQSNKVDVFLTQMWQDVDWNAFEGVNRLQSAPKSVTDFAQGMAALMDFLINTNHYDCIRWVCVANEPGVDVAWWNGPGNQPASLMPAIRALRKELDQRGLQQIIISGPDWHLDMDPQGLFDFNDGAIGAHDAHHYGSASKFEKFQKLWADRAHARGIPFFQTEFGSSIGDNPQDNPTSLAPRSFASQLENARNILLGLRYGVDGFNRWSFVNRGDLDGQWQMLKTWNPNQWEYYPKVQPEPVPYFSYGILTRLTARHSDILQSSSMLEDLVYAALRSPKGNLTIYLVNLRSAGRKIQIRLAGLGAACTLHKYQVTEKSVTRPGFTLEPLKAFELGGKHDTFSDRLPARSITAYSTYHLKGDGPGVIDD